MDKRNLSVKNVVYILLLIYLTSICFRSLSKEPKDQPARLYGVPTITSSYSVLENCSIDQIVEDDQFIYVLYGNHDGNVQVFDLNGNYQYSAYFYCHLNGAFSIAAQNNMLYVRDEHRNIYILGNGKFYSFVEEEDAADLLSSIDFNETSENYEVRFGSIWIVNDKVEKCIIKRPFHSALYQNNFMFILSLCIPAALGLFFYFNKKKKDV